MSFAFRHQPLKTIYLIGSISTLVFLRIPYWTATNLLPSWRPRSSWSLGRALIIKGFAAFIYPEKTGFVWVDPAPEYVVGELAELAQKNNVEPARIWGFWLGPKGPDGLVGQKPKPGEKVVMHMHGGSYAMGSAHPDDDAKVSFEGMVEYYPKNVRLFGIDYRLSSAAPYPAKNPFPAAVIDCIAAFRYLVEVVGFAPEDIVVSGDSAGGGLAIALTHYLVKQRFPTLRSPGGLILISPSVDWSLSHDGPGTSAQTNERADLAGPVYRTGYAQRCLRGTLGPEILDTVWISAGSAHLKCAPGDFALPRTIILVGGLEMMLDPTRTLRDRLVADMGEGAVTYIEVADATHDPINFTWHEPERSEILRAVAGWLEAF
ncbi:alpha/beta-hydrolase [Amylocystis lapponica]|nr:alpha/beta-hydrolase [Amylocystis lapponica]